MLFDKMKKKEAKEKGHLKNVLQNSGEGNADDNAIKEASIHSKPDDGAKIKFGIRRWKTRKIIKDLYERKIYNVFFYTNVENVLRQIEVGIQPINSIKLMENQEYVVWTYLEKENHIDFELENSTRYAFWNWMANNDVDPDEIAVYGINLSKLFANTVKEWVYDEMTNRISVFETVSISCVDWILVKRNDISERLATYAKSSRIKVKLLLARNGEVTELN